MLNRVSVGLCLIQRVGIKTFSAPYLDLRSFSPGQHLKLRCLIPLSLVPLETDRLQTGLAVVRIPTRKECRCREMRRTGTER